MKTNCYDFSVSGTFLYELSLLREALSQEQFERLIHGLNLMLKTLNGKVKERHGLTFEHKEKAYSAIHDEALELMQVHIQVSPCLFSYLYLINIYQLIQLQSIHLSLPQMQNQFY